MLWSFLVNLLPMMSNDGFQESKSAKSQHMFRRLQIAQLASQNRSLMLEKSNQKRDPVSQINLAWI